MANKGYSASSTDDRTGHSLRASKWVLGVFHRGMTGSGDKRSAANIKAIPRNGRIIGLVICGVRGNASRIGRRQRCRSPRCDTDRCLRRLSPAAGGFVKEYGKAKRSNLGIGCEEGGHWWNRVLHTSTHRSACAEMFTCERNRGQVTQKQHGTLWGGISAGDDVLRAPNGFPTELPFSRRAARISRKRREVRDARDRSRHGLDERRPSAAGLNGIMRKRRTPLSH